MAQRNARLRLRSRRLLCQRIDVEGWTVAEAMAAGVSRQAASK